MNDGAVCIYGASGWTGQQLAADLSARGVPIILAGRSVDRLRPLAAKLRPKPPVRPATVEDAGALDNALRGARLVINCAGPYADTGVPVLSAALRMGADYVDIAGEIPHVGAVYRDWDAAAKRAGIVVCPGVAAKGAFGDWGVHLLARILGAVPDEVVITYAHALRQFLRPSTASALSAAAQGFVGKPWPIEERSRVVELPAPFGRGDSFRVPGAEDLSVPRHLPVRSVRTYISVDPGGPGNAEWASALRAGYRWLPLLGRIMSSEWGRWHTRVYFPPPVQHQDPDTFGVVIEGRIGPRAAAISFLTSDAYVSSSAVLTHVVERMLASRPLPGVRAPAELVEPIPTLRALSDSGVIRVVQRQG